MIFYKIHHFTVRIRGKDSFVGTGFLVHQSGLIATCYHVVEDACGSKNEPISAGNSLEFVTLDNRPGWAIITEALDERCDIALLQVKGDIPLGLQSVPLLDSKAIEPQQQFTLTGYGEVPEEQQHQHRYDYVSAKGSIVGPAKRDDVDLLQIESSQLLNGMSGGAIYCQSLGGVVGLLSERFNSPDWFRYTGWVIPAEALVQLAPDKLKVVEPVLSDLITLSREFVAKFSVYLARDLANDQRVHDHGSESLGPMTGCRDDGQQRDFELAYETLPDDESRRRLRMLGVFAPNGPDFNTEMAAALWADSLNNTMVHLQKFHDVALLWRTDETQERWALPVLMGDYARALLEEHPEEQRLARERYTRYVIHLSLDLVEWRDLQPDWLHLQYIGNQLITDTETLLKYDAEQISIDTPIPALSEAERVELEDRARFLSALFPPLFARPEARGVARRWLTAFVAIANALEEPEAKANGLTALGGWSLIYESRVEQAEQYFNHAQQIGETQHNPQLIGSAQLGKAIALQRQGRTPEAIQILQSILDRLGQSPETAPQLQVQTLSILSGLSLSRSDLDVAARYIEQALPLLEQLDDAYLHATINQRLGMLQLHRQKPQKALPLFDLALDSAQQLDDAVLCAEIENSLGLAYLESDLDLAEQYFDRALQRVQALAPSWLATILANTALVKYARGNLAAAQQDLEQATNILTQHQDVDQEAQVLALQGEIAHKMGYPSKALEHLQQALDMLTRPDVQNTSVAVKVINGICVIYRDAGKIEQGIQFLEQQLPHIQKLNSTGAEGAVLTWLVILLDNVGDVEQATFYLERALPIVDKLDNDTERAMIKTLLGRIYTLHGEMDRAYELAREVVTLCRRLPNRITLSEALLHLTELCLGRGNLDEGQGYLEEVRPQAEAEDNAPMRAAFYHLQGVLSLQTGRDAEALEYLEKSVQVNESLENPFLQIGTLVCLAPIHMKRSNFEAAQKCLEKAKELTQQVKFTPHTVNVLLLLAQLHYMRGHPEQAATMLDEMATTLEEAEAPQQNSAHWRTLATALRQEGTQSLPQESIQLLLQARDKESVHLIVRARFAVFQEPAMHTLMLAAMAQAKYLGHEALAGALEFYDRLLRDSTPVSPFFLPQMHSGPTDPALDHWWAYLHRSNRHYSTALTHINYALTTRPHHVPALLERAWIARGMGQYASAQEDFERAAKLRPYDYRPYQGLGVLLYETQRWGEALAHLSKAMKMQPDDTYTYQWRAAVYQALTDISPALEDLDEAVRRAPQVHEHRYWRAIGRLHAQRFEEARQDLNYMIDIDSEMPSKQAYDYLWRGVSQDHVPRRKPAARADWQRGLARLQEQQTSEAQWGRLLLRLVSGVEERVPEILLPRPVIRHVLVTQLQHLGLLTQLYPSNSGLSDARQRIEREIHEISQR